MPFNENDQMLPPYVGGIMTLTHEECVNVKGECEVILDNFVPDRYNPTPDNVYVISRYNQLSDYKEAINGDTYNVVMMYDEEYNTQGIDENGIIPEPVEETPEEPTEEEETPTEPEEETPVEEEPPAGEDQPEEETPVEEEQPETMAEEITAEEEK